MERSNQTKYIFLEILAVCFLATGGIFVKHSALSPVNTGFYRVLFSFPFLLPLAWKNIKSISKKDAAILFFAGIFLSGDVALWNLSFMHTSVANANLLANLTPFTVIPMSHFLFKEKVPKFFFVGASITVLGVVILLGGKINPSAITYLGDLMSFGASVFYAFFLLISYMLRERISSSVIMLFSGFGSLAGLFVSSCLMEGLRVPSGFWELWPLLGLALCLQVIGHNLLAHCSGKISINLSTIVCLLQPVFASIYSFFLFGEKLSFMEIVGIAVVILGVYLVKLQFRK